MIPALLLITCMGMAAQVQSAILTLLTLLPMFSLAEMGPWALVVAPTRELAQQIAAVLESAGQPAGLATLCAYGGVPKQAQAQALRRGVDVLVATPGRLEDLMNDGACKSVPPPSCRHHLPLILYSVLPDKPSGTEMLCMLSIFV